MSRNFILIAFAALLTATACGGGGDQAAKSLVARGTKKVDPATTATLAGTAAFEGTPPRNAPISLASDPACGTTPVTSESILVDNGGLQNVFVYIKDDLGSQYAFEVPTEPVTLDQKGCHYVPHVVGVRTTQPLEIVNSDNTMHNVHGMPEANREFNVGQPVAGMKTPTTFTTPEVLIPFKCDVHSWMHAYIGVVDHPYFAVSGSGGKFELKGIPPGTYTVEAVHEKLGRQAQSVTLGDKDAKTITFTFKPAV
jgi:plastocyanin